MLLGSRYYSTALPEVRPFVVCAKCQAENLRRLAVAEPLLAKWANDRIDSLKEADWITIYDK